MYEAIRAPSVYQGLGASLFLHAKYRMNVHMINDMSDSYALGLLKTGLSNIPAEQGSKNYAYEHRDLNSNLFYVLEHGRFRNGTYYVIEDDGKYIASAGWNPYTESIALLMTRMYVIQSKRSQYFMGELLLPKMIESVKDYPDVYMTFNEHNKALYTWIERMKPGTQNIWPSIWSQFDAIGKQIIYNTDQYVVRLRK